MTEHINLVNRLLQETFGKGVRGNIGIEPAGGITTILELDYLELIAKNSRLPIPILWETWVIYGTFGLDGSTLKIKPDYYNKALKFKEAYEKETGKSIELVVAKQIPI